MKDNEASAPGLSDDESSQDLCVAGKPYPKTCRQRGLGPCDKLPSLGHNAPPMPHVKPARVEVSRLDDLAMLVHQLVRALHKAAPDNDLSQRALDYLARHGLQGSPLREAVRSGQRAGVTSAMVRAARDELDPHKPGPYLHQIKRAIEAAIAAAPTQQQEENK